MARSRRLRQLLPRILGVVIAVLTAATPGWAVIAAFASAGLGAQRGTGFEASGVAEGIEEEEESETTASLPREDLVIRRGELRRDDRAPLSFDSRRRRAGHDSVVAALRWSSYVAPARAPPLRLLN